MSHRISQQRLVGSAVFGSMVCGTFGLGVWQSQRYQWKIDLIKSRAHALDIPAIQVSGSAVEEKPLYQKLRIRGYFDYRKQVRIGPRSPPPGLLPKGQGLSSGPQGYEIITSFITQDGTHCLVNRGWQPKDIPLPNDSHTFEKEMVEALVVRGESQEKSTFSPLNTPTQILWIEMPFIASLLNLPSTKPIYLIAVDGEDHSSSDHEDSSSSNTIDWPKARSSTQLLQVAVDPPTHLVYAVTWFSLSIAGAFMTRRLLFPKPTMAATRRAAAAAAAAEREL